LRIIAEKGPDAFYRGEIARQMARDISANGGYVREEDLASYEARPLRIVRGQYRGHELVGSGRPPSGYMVIEALQIMDQFDLPQADPAEWAAVVGQAIALAREDRETLPGPHAEKERRMVSSERALERAAQVRLGSGGTRKLSPSVPEGEAHTTHLSAADAKGMVVAMTQSLGPRFGSKVATPGLGFLYAATLGGYKGRIEPGERARLSQSPLLVLQAGRPRLVLGAAGGARIPSAIVNVVARMLDQRLSLGDAIAASRVHPQGDGFGLDGADVVTIEARIDDDRLEGTLSQEPGESFRITGTRAVSSPGATGTWALKAGFGGLFELGITEGLDGLRAKLASDWPLLRARSSSSVTLDAGTLTITMPPPSSGGAGVAEGLAQLGFETEAVPQVARVHAVAWDAARSEWIGVADPRGRGSARGPTEVP
jgi:gamma-glutamyltranspeptidase/glutathione hydrolase